VFGPEDDRKEVNLTEAEEEELTAAVMVSEPLMPREAKAPVEDQEKDEPLVEESLLEVEGEAVIEDVEQNENFDILFLLGDEVGDQFERIDSGLDALEELVLSIESGMSAFDELDEEKASATSDEGEVSEAA